MAIAALQIWVWFATAVIVLATIRAWQATWQRSADRPRLGFHGLIDSEPPPVTAIIAPADAADARTILDALAASTYPKWRLEILCLDSGTSGAAREVVERYTGGALAVRWISAAGTEDRAATLARAVQGAAHDIALVFDGGTTPGRDVVRSMAMPFIDPEVGAVTGRVLPRNATDSTLARLLALEQSGADLDRQVRNTHGSFPRLSAGVSAYRRAALTAAGVGPGTSALEHLRIAGWNVLYAHRAESYADAPSSWELLYERVRDRARERTRAALALIGPVLHSTLLSGGRKWDAAALVLGAFAAPFGLSVVLADALLLSLGALPVVPAVVFAFCVANCSAFGTAPAVFTAGAADLIDGRRQRLLLLPWLCWLAVFESCAETAGVADALRSGA